MLGFDLLARGSIPNRDHRAFSREILNGISVTGITSVSCEGTRKVWFGLVWFGLVWFGVVWCGQRVSGRG
jgi:hypothetical protein